MALKGSYYTNIGAHWRLSIEWSATQNTSSNTSTITSKMYWEALDGYGAVNSSATKTSAIQIDNGSWSTESGDLSQLSANQKKLINTYVKTVSHNDNGTGTFSIDGYFDAEVTLGGVYYGTINLDQKDYTLDTIDRKSTLSSSANWTAGNNFTLSVSRGSSSFKHEAEIYVKTRTGEWNWINQVVFSTSETSKSSSFTFAEADEIYGHLDGRASCDSRILLQTYNGSTHVGTNEYFGTVSKANNSTLSSSDNWTAGSNFTVSISRVSSFFRHEAEIYVKTTAGVWNWINQVSFNTSQTSLSSAFTVAENEEIFNHLAQRSSCETKILIQTFIDDRLIGDNEYFGVVTAPSASTLSPPSSFNIGSSFTVPVSRANSGFTHTIRLKNGSTILKSYTNVGTSISVTTSDITSTLYNATPNSNTLNLTLECLTYYGYQVRSATTKSVSAKVTNSNPSFPSSNITYTDIRTLTTGITGNSAYIIQGQSDVRVNIVTATGVNGATIKNYIATINGVEKSRTTSGILDFGRVNAGTNVTLSVKAVDSRGTWTTASKTITIVPYKSPSAAVTLKRKNNFENETTLQVTGSISLVNVNSVNQNSLQLLEYRYKNTKSSTWSSWFTDLTYATVASSYTATKILDLDNNYAYEVEVKITDKIVTTSGGKTVPVGKPIFFIDAINSAVGVNDFPLAGEALRVKGNVVIDGEFSIASQTWFPLILQNGWTVYSANYPPQYSVQGNSVIFRGRMFNGLLGGANYAPAFTLPSNLKTAMTSSQILGGYSSNYWARVYILEGGGISIITTATGSTIEPIDLSGLVVRFK